MAAQTDSDAAYLALEASLNPLLVRAQTLLDEITAFESLFHSAKIDVDIRVFKREVCGEERTLECLAVTLRTGRGESVEEPINTPKIQTKPSERKTKGSLCVANRVDSSNLSWYETLWATAKRQSGVAGILRSIHTFASREAASRPESEERHRLEHTDRNDRQLRENLVVDIIADGGLEWIKVSTITPKRLLYEIAREGWNGYDSDSEVGSDAASDEQSKGSHDGSNFALVRLAQDMRIAARAVRVRYQHPKIRFILPNIEEGVAEEVDAMLAGIRATGSIVDCSGTAYTNQAGGNMSPTSHGAGDLRMMLPLIHSCGPRLTSTLNIDCTILLSLISDISHILKEDLVPAPAGRYCNEVLKQLEADARSPLLPNELYPKLGNRELVCTTEAARRMREIVETMGTHSERKRANIFFGEGPTPNWSSGQDLLSALRECSAHAVPNSLKLPINVVDYDVDAVLSGSISPKHLPVPIARNVINNKLHLSNVNKSMFLYGWDAGIVTVTGNRAATTQIERAINEALNESENGTGFNGHGCLAEACKSPPLNEQPAIDAEQSEVRKSDIRLGPDFLYSTPRSLIGKDKGKEGDTDRLNASTRACEKRCAK